MCSVVDHKQLCILLAIIDHDGNARIAQQKIQDPKLGFVGEVWEIGVSLSGSTQGRSADDDGIFVTRALVRYCVLSMV